MVRDRRSGKFLYTERLERRPGETPWEYVRRSVRREARIREKYANGGAEILVGWRVGSVEEFLRDFPEYGNPESNEERPGPAAEEKSS